MFRQTAIFYFPRKVTYATSCCPILKINQAAAAPSTPTSFKFTPLFQRNVHSSPSLKQVVSKNYKGKILSPSASINISENAVKQLIKIQSQAKNSKEALRVILESGGCHELQNYV
ncbi:[4Fe-4S] proteins maturation [Entomophthora muscae]|uniref:[4Fe-4S] proteins maturation n=1 Tax=Entomophthora muscae TaxID=34485 RepID=A0ACC2SPT1_9FUNG|nr:[4Fe-4S] proteins maturation [Entomophthora muscae]